MLPYLVFSVLIVILALTCSPVQPKLNPTLSAINNIYVRAVIVFVVVYIATKHLVASLAVALILLGIQMLIIRQNKEGYANWGGDCANYGTPLSQCGGYDASQANRVGTIFYPLNDNPTQQKLRNQGLGNVLDKPSGDFAFY